MKLTEDAIRKIDLGNGLEAIVDEYDYPLVSAFKWNARPSRKTHYARSMSSRDAGSKTLIMHRLIIGAGPGDIVDHIDRNGLNNRRSNLRIVSHGHNSANAVFSNKYGFRGVGFDPKCRTKPWQAKAKFNGKSITFGHFQTKEEAAVAHDMGIFSLRRDPALMNFPEMAAALAQHKEK